MLFLWFVVTMPAIESIDVIRLRLIKMTCGCRDAQRECELMIAEKISAFVEATLNLCAGATPAMTVGRYREHVAANAFRLAV